MRPRWWISLGLLILLIQRLAPTSSLRAGDELCVGRADWVFRVYDVSAFMHVPVLDTEDMRGVLTEDLKSLSEIHRHLSERASECPNYSVWKCQYSVDYADGRLTVVGPEAFHRRVLNYIDSVEEQVNEQVEARQE